MDVHRLPIAAIDVKVSVFSMIQILYMFDGNKFPSSSINSAKLLHDPTPPQPLESQKSVIGIPNTAAIERTTHPARKSVTN